MLSLEVLISTIGRDGIRRVASMGLPAVEGISYLVSWQGSEGETMPAELEARGDLRVIHCRSIGLSRNRNNALDHAVGDVLLIADDDLSYLPEGLEAVRRAFEKDPQLEIGLFRYRNEAGGYEKLYPQSRTEICRRLPKGYFPTSMEIAVRRESRAGKLRFNEEFGLGAPMLKCGEEELFLLLARKAGCKICFFPTDLCTHRGQTTGSRKVTDRGVYRGMGATVALLYPLTFLPRFVLIAWRGKRRGKMKFFPALAGFISGAVYMIFCVRPLRRGIQER